MSNIVGFETRPRLKTKDIAPRGETELVKPAEIIGVMGLEHLDLADHMTFNRLLKNAWGSRMEDPTADFFIPLAELRGKHGGNDRVRNSLRKLQQTLIQARLSDGSVRTVQLLGACDIDDTERAHGVLKYDFHRKLVPLLRKSELYARLDMKIMATFTSKFTVALYESICQRINLRYKANDKLTLAEFRQWIGVPSGKLERWPDLRRKAIEKAVAEINKESPFNVSIVPVFKGRAVTHVNVAWSKKEPLSDEEQSIVREANRHRAGRKARRDGTVEIIPPLDAMQRRDGAEIIERRTGTRPDIYSIEAQWRDYVRGVDTRPPDYVQHWLGFCQAWNGK